MEKETFIMINGQKVKVTLSVEPKEKEGEWVEDKVNHQPFELKMTDKSQIILQILHIFVEHRLNSNQIVGILGYIAAQVVKAGVQTLSNTTEEELSEIMKMTLIDSMNHFLKE